MLERKRRNHDVWVVIIIICTSERKTKNPANRREMCRFVGDSQSNELGSPLVLIYVTIKRYSNNNIVLCTKRGEKNSIKPSIGVVFE